jgi:hypothetical protein
MEVLILLFALLAMIAALLAGFAGLPLVLVIGVATLAAMVIARVVVGRRVKP